MLTSRREGNGHWIYLSVYLLTGLRNFEGFGHFKQFLCLEERGLTSVAWPLEKDKGSGISLQILSSAGEGPEGRTYETG